MNLKVDFIPVHPVVINGERINISFFSPSEIKKMIITVSVINANHIMNWYRHMTHSFIWGGRKDV